MITLFPNEKVITESDGRVLTLTTHRICLEEKAGGRLNYQHIMLEHVTSTEVTGINYFYLLWLAGIFVAASLYLGMNDASEQSVFSFAIAVFLVIVFFVTRQYTIIIGCASTKIKVNATNMSKETISDFLNKVELAQNERIISLK